MRWRYFWWKGTCHGPFKHNFTHLTEMCTFTVSKGYLPLLLPRLDRSHETAIIWRFLGPLFYTPQVTILPCCRLQGVQVLVNQEDGLLISHLSFHLGIYADIYSLEFLWWIHEPQMVSYIWSFLVDLELSLYYRQNELNK